MTRRSRAPLRILIAEDSPGVGECIALVLRSAGRDVELVGDGLAAADMAQVCRPDVALLDIEMPKLDGFAAAWQIRRAKGDAIRCRAVRLRSASDQAGRHGCPAQDARGPWRPARV